MINSFNTIGLQKQAALLFLRCLYIVSSGKVCSFCVGHITFPEHVRRGELLVPPSYKLASPFLQIWSQILAVL